MTREYDDGADELLQQLHDLPPSAKRVYRALEAEGSMTQKQLREEADISERTARYALNQLEDIGAVEGGMFLGDARQNLYNVTDKYREVDEADDIEHL